MKKKSLLALVLAVTMLVSLLIGTVGAEAKTSVSFDEKNIVLSFGVMSDTHFDSKYTDSDNHKNAAFYVTSAINFIKNKIGENNMPILCMGGDLTYDMGLTDLPLAEAALKSCLDPKKTEVLVTPGNHDEWCTNNRGPESDPLSKKSVFSDYNLFSEKIGDYVYHDKTRTDKDMMTQGYYHTVVRGYHFLSVVDFTETMDINAINWLKKEIESIRKSGNNSKPIFVQAHVAAKNTVIGTITGGSNRNNPSTNLLKQMKKYPEVVVISGHSHANLNDEHAIWQEDTYTAVHAGGMVQNQQFGIMEIDKNDHIRYTCYQINYDKDAEGYASNASVSPIGGRVFTFTVNEYVAPVSSETTSKATSKATSEESKATEKSKETESVAETSEKSDISVAEEVSEESGITEIESVVSEGEESSVTDVAKEVSSEAQKESAPGAWIYIVVGAVVVIGIGVLLFFLLTKKKEEPQE